MPDCLTGLGLYWGKARPGQAAARCHLLAYHCMDVAAVGMAALQRLPGLRALFTRRLAVPEHLIEPWIAFWLALHDLGKFAESFARRQCWPRSATD